MQNYYLYKITNLVNGKMYIGITNNPTRRWHQHLNYKKRIKNSVNILYSAMDKHGIDNFKFEVICVGSKEYIVDLERKAIELYETKDKAFGYNIKDGGQTGLSGYSLEKTAKDVPHYVSGFWFPNVRTAIKCIGIDKSTFLRRKRMDVLGEIVQKNLKKDWSIVPTYVAGIWWPNIFVASEKLGVSKEALKARIKRGTVEEVFNLRDQDGDKNHMCNIPSNEHPSSKPVEIGGKRYNSIKDASESTGISKYILRKILNKQNNSSIERE